MSRLGNIAVLNHRLGVARSNANAAGKLARRTLHNAVLDHVARVLVRRERVLILPNLNTISTNVVKLHRSMTLSVVRVKSRPTPPSREKEQLTKPMREQSVNRTAPSASL